MKNLNLIACVSVIFLLSCGDNKSKEKESITAQDPGNLTASTSSPKDSVRNENLSSSETTTDTLENIPGANPDSTQSPASLGHENDNDSLKLVESRPADPELFASVAPGLKHRIEVAKLPKSSTIGIRSYPNAYVVKLNTKTQYKGKMYVTMELASEDQADEVLAFYNTWRDTWHYIEDSEVHTFKKDKDKYFRETNTLQILPFSKSLDPELDSLLSFNAQTLIRIYYEDIK